MALMHETQSATARLADGVELRYGLRGGDSGRRIALIHSLALNQDVWQPVAEALSADASVLTYDCRGHGASTRAAGPYSLDLFTDDLAGLLDHVGWPAATVVGASMGGSVALAFATRHPGRIEGLGLVDTTAWYGPDAERTWEERAQRALAEGLAALIPFQLTRWFSDSFRQSHPEMVAHFSDVFTANDPECYAAACRMLGSFDLRPQLGAIRVPTAVIVGEEDYATPVDMAEQLHAGIAGSTLHVLPAARHLSPLERPTQVAALVGGLPVRQSHADRG
jgi:3-oxoadipate enol-lactonase